MAALPPRTAAPLVVTPGPLPLVVGAITFSHEECPEQFPLGGGEQMTVVHNMPGGGVILNTFGNKPKQVQFGGRWFAGNIWPRVQQMRLYQVSGEVVTIAWWNESYSAIVREFDPGYRNGYNEWSVTLEIVSANNGAFSVASTTSVDQQVAALQSQAVSQNAAIASADPTGSASFQSALAAALLALEVAMPLAQLATEQSSSLTALIGTAVAAVQVYQGQIGVSAPQYVNTIALIAALNAIASNVTQGQSPQTITVLGGDLFGIASRYCDDPSRAFEIQKANGLTSVFLGDTTPTTLILPPSAVAA